MDFNAPFADAPGLDPARLGRVTASEIYKIMGSGRSAEFTAGGYSYLNAKVAERLTGRFADSYEGTAQRWGKDLEAEALSKVSDSLGLGIVPVPFQKVGNYFGFTPDAKVIDAEIGIEVKCPYNSANMVDYLELRSAEDLKELEPGYYWQVMSSLFWSGWGRWVWAAYDPRFIEEDRKLKLLTITPVTADFDLLRKKTTEAVKYLNKWT